MQSETKNEQKQQSECSRCSCWLQGWLHWQQRMEAGLDALLLLIVAITAIVTFPVEYANAILVGKMLVVPSFFWQTHRGLLLLLRMAKAAE